MLNDLLRVTHTHLDLLSQIVQSLTDEVFKEDNAFKDIFI
jgi:hypothetical protein